MSREIEEALAKEHSKKPNFGKFEILAGMHNEGGKVFRFKRGAVTTFWSKYDLRKKNSHGSMKFRLIELANGESVEVVDEGEETLEAKINAMGMQELRAYAEENEIDISGLRKKKDIAAEILNQSDDGEGLDE